MRLEPAAQAAIAALVRRHFGVGARAWLFGSRTNDGLRGGDIDLYLDAGALTATQVQARKVALLADLHAALGDQRIDLVVQRHDGPTLPIHRVARATGVELG